MIRSALAGLAAMVVVLVVLWRASGPAAAAMASAACVFAFAVGVVLADRRVEP